MRLALVIPTHNEERRIGETLDAYTGFFDEKKRSIGLDYELLVVINNTNDRTPNIVKKHQKRNRFIKSVELEKGGKGNAVVEGFKITLKKDFDLAGFVDADMATPPEEFWKLVSSIEGYDGAFANRYISGSRIYPQHSIQRLLAKRLFNFWVRSILMIPYRDTQCGAKVFRRNALERVIPTMTTLGWAFDVELLYNMKKLGYKLASVPTSWSNKEFSQINFWQSGPRMALSVLRLRIIHSPLKDIVRLYNRLPFKLH